MHNFQNFSELFNAESLKTENDFKSVSLPSLGDIKNGFNDILKIAQIDAGYIKFAYVAGSYSRGQQTAYSDIDIECFADIDCEEQYTFNWNDTLVSFSIYPMNTVRGESENIIDLSWAKSCFKSAHVLHDPEGLFEIYKKRFVNNKAVFEMSLGLGKQMRKLVEYRRKLIAAVSKRDELGQGFAAARFIETYTTLAHIMNQSEISSEKDQFNVLSGALRVKALSLMSEDLNVHQAIELTAPFFEHTNNNLKRKIKSLNI